MKTSKAIIAVVVIAVVGFVATRFMPKAEDQILVPPTEPVPTKETGSLSSSTPVATPTPSTQIGSVYKDGSYSARGTYYSPEGLERITINITLKNDIIVNTSAVNEAGDGTSVRYQNVFINNYKQLVVGKNIDEVVLHKVSGSSLTGAGFNQAVGKIKAEAKA